VEEVGKRRHGEVWKALDRFLAEEVLRLAVEVKF
jgi:hypothetical protein